MMPVIEFSVEAPKKWRAIAVRRPSPATYFKIGLTHFTCDEKQVIK
jgi:hypothetical protein